MKKKTPKRRSPEAQSLKNYKPKIIQTKPRYPSVADEFDDWYFSNDRGINGEADNS